MAHSPSSTGDGGGGDQHGLEIPPVMADVLRPHQISALQFIWKRLVLSGVLHTAARTFSSTIEQRTRLFQEVFGVILGHSMGLGKTLTSLTFLLLLQAQVTLMAMKRERLRQKQQQERGSGGSTAAGSGALLRGGSCPALRVLVLCPRSCVLHWQASIAEWVQPRYAGSVHLQTHVPSAMGISAAGGQSRSGGKTLDDVLVTFYQQGGVLLLGYEEYQRVLQYAQAHYRNYPATTWPRVWSLLDRIRLPLPLTQEVRLLDMMETADLVILDEAHRLRRTSSNLVTALAQHLRNIQLRLALTGTPLQNHLEEYNTMQSIVTGRELDTQLFYKHFIAPIELGQCVDSTYAQFLEMQRCVASLRNYFADSAHHCGPEVLAATLPPRREFIFFFRLSEAQEVAYRAMLKRVHRQLGSAEKGESVLRLHHQASHICLHPALAELDNEGASASVGTHGSAGDVKVTEDSDNDEDGEGGGPALQLGSPLLSAAALRSVVLSDSPKLSFALHLAVYIVKSLREKVIIFSQYLSHLKLMGELLAQEGISASALTGASSDVERRRCIDELQTNPDCRVLMCSVRAGGVGIKLTAANHCILLDVSWNPADDTQATYRLYRYGQLRPVNVYRLATYGTSEHVVFAYALQKSWLQKKITDVTDPRRQQRHQTRSYFRYPCSVPLPDGAAGGSLSELAEASSSSPSSSQVSEQALLAQRRRDHALDVCDAQCPVAAHVLAANADVEEAQLYTVIPHSTLLRHNDEDVIRERACQFEKAAVKKIANVPVPLHLNRSGGPCTQRDDQSLLDACESELVDVARQTAHLLITHVLRVRDDARDDSVRSSRGDTVSEVRTLDRLLCRHLQGLVSPARLGKRPPPRVLAEVLLWCFQAGAERLSNTLLHGGAHLKLRTFLTSRIPAANRHRPRDAPLPTRSPLEEALFFRPLGLLRAMSAVEATYVSTELGCDRPLVGHCMVKGVQRLWVKEGEGGSSAGSAAALDVESLQALSVLLGTRATGDGDDDSEEDNRDAVTDATDEVMAHNVLWALVGCLEEQWPPYEGLTLPTQHLQLDREEMRMERAYSAAARAHTVGLLPLGEVAELLRLPRYRQGHHSYGCARCHHLLLHRLDATHLECPRCHFNAEFEVRADARVQQQTTLYQLSVVANLLDTFSITKSFATSFSPADCADVSAVLREVRTSQAVLEFVRQVMGEGVRVFLSEYPPVLVRLMGLQLGTGGDLEELGRVLCANGRYASHTNMREHLRHRLTQAYADFVHPSKLAQLAAMPFMFVVSALHHFARYENITYAHELLVVEYPTPHRKLLRFASDALVKVLYVERLLRHCKERPQPQAPAAADAVNAKGTGAFLSAGAGGSPVAEEGEADVDDVMSLRSLLRAASSSSSSGSSTGEVPARRAASVVSSSCAFSLSLSSSSSEDDGKSSELRATSRPATTRTATTHHVVHSVHSSDSATSSKDLGGDTGSTSPSRSSSSSFHSAYSADRESFPDCDSESDGDETEAGARDARLSLDAADTWLEALTQNVAAINAPTAEELESEAVLQQRSAQYWIAFCEVYGTHSAEALTVFIEDDVDGVKALPPPPLPLWVSQVAHTTMAGLRVGDMLDLFLKKLLELSQQVRLIA
jgi:SNF2 family DNA or RNA helicase